MKFVKRWVSQVIFFVPLLILAAGLLARGARSQEADISSHVLYLAPMWINGDSVLDAEYDANATLLKQKFSSGAGVKLGFSSYLSIDMNCVGPEIAAIE